MNCATVLITSTLVLSSAESNKRSIFKALSSPLTAPAESGYLNNGEPFLLRKAAPFRPPAYALPPLPITPDPQPLPLAALKPVQPMNPAGTQQGASTSQTTIPAMQMPSIRPLTVKVEPTFVSPALGAHSAVGQSAQLSHRNAFLNPEIFRYFNGDANGTMKSRIRLNDNSLFTLPNMSPLLRRQGSTTYQIK
tara:strand:- start:670 stop:1248 length:579 start_codon:yes stop_codon:yes gene_type:complete